MVTTDATLRAIEKQLITLALNASVTAIDDEVLPLVLAAIAADAQACRQLAKSPRVVLFVDEARAVGTNDALQALYRTCVGCLGANIGVVFTALTDLLPPLIAATPSTNRPIVSYSLVPIAVAHPRFLSLVETRLADVLPRDHTNRSRAVETLHMLLAHTGGHARTIEWLLASVWSLGQRCRADRSLLNDLKLLMDVVSPVSNKSYSSVLPSACAWLGPSMFQLVCSGAADAAAGKAFAAGSLINAQHRAEFVPKVSLYTVFHGLPPSVFRALWSPLDDPGEVFERLWLPGIALKLASVKRGSPWWPSDLAQPLKFALFGDDGLIATPHSRSGSLHSSVATVLAQDEPIVVGDDIFGGKWHVHTDTNAVLCTTLRNNVAIDGVVLLRLEDGTAHAVLMQLKRSEGDSTTNIQFQHVRAVIDKVDKQVSRFLSDGNRSHGLRKYGVTRADQFTLCIVALRNLGRELFIDHNYVEQYCCDKGIRFNVCMLGPDEVKRTLGPSFETISLFTSAGRSAGRSAARKRNLSSAASDVTATQKKRRAVVASASVGPRRVRLWSKKKERFVWWWQK